MMENKEIYFSTGCDLLDMAVGGAQGVFGLPAGKFCNLVGDRSAGKTFLAIEIVTAAYWKYGKNFKWVYDDCESGYSFNTQELYGFQLVNEDTPRSETIEQAFCNISIFAEGLKKNEFGIYVIDSLDGLSSKEADTQAGERIKAHKAGKEYAEGSYNMGKPRYLSREFFPQLCSVIQDKNILVIIISQVRENIDMFSFEKFKRNGGKALDFYAHTVLWLATMKKVIRKERSVGVVVKAKVTKSKTSRPFRECLFTLLFDYGLDNTGTSLDFLYELRTDKGQLTPMAKSIPWGEEGTAEKPNVLKIKKWLKETVVKTGGKPVTALDKFSEGNERFTLNALMEFINSDNHLKEEYQKAFYSAGGGVYSRDKLIELIEADNEQEVRLKQLVIDKWEGVESEIRTSRKKRYGTQPKGGEV